MAECPTGFYFDINDQVCKDVQCERGNVVVVANTGARVFSVNTWKYMRQGTISAVTPSSGQVSTPVEITGDFLFASGDNVATVTPGGVQASITDQSDNSVSVIVTAGAPGTGAVVL